MKKCVIGILAHVDAGKTTLSEAILYKTGIIKNLGRVDNKNSYLDTDDMERSRGITIFSKQAVFETDTAYFTLLDTPGHVDFSAEMERTLQVLDYAILVISASDGIQGHTKTLWKLLNQYNIPVYIFVNKMDQPDNHKEVIINSLKSQLSVNCIDFSGNNISNDDLESIAVNYADFSGDEEFLESFLDSGIVHNDIIKELIGERLIYPCYFGSALRLEGVDELLIGLDKYTQGFCSDDENTNDEFGAKVYKITRDEKNQRLVHLKITSGCLQVKDSINDEKVNQIRIYNGDKFDTVNIAFPGSVCAVTGLENVNSGDCLGIDSYKPMKLLEPVISYQIIVPEGVSGRQVYPKLKQLEEELPELSLMWNEDKEEIKVKLMGQVQIDVLKTLISKRFGFIPDFDLGSITYKESIADSTIGVGHFEPSRHYAEVHLLIEPGERGSGINVYSDVSEDLLDKNWQRLIKTHILERTHKGVLTGSSLTDVKITLINGKAHLKHTEGGDFRQATYRAVRNGLMYGESILLEPYYDFELNIPSDMVGKAMIDIQSMNGTMNSPDIKGDLAIISGRGPVSTMRNYQVNVNSYTKGKGHITLNFSGYDICHNQTEVIESIGYNPDEDIKNPASSVFCAHGAGFVVPWYQVRDYMHLSFNKDTKDENIVIVDRKERFDYSIGTDEIDEILNKTYNSNTNNHKKSYKKKREEDYFNYSKAKVSQKPKEKIYLIDGYNVIFAWKDLKELSTLNIDSAKDKLISVISEYRAIVDTDMILVFDGYKVQDNKGSEAIIEGITVVHTKENETADAYIERFANTNKDKLNITVVTSDSLIRQLTTGNNCRVVKSVDFEKEIMEEKSKLREIYKLD